MKLRLWPLFFMVTSFSTSSQVPYDYVWTLGIPTTSGNPHEDFGGTNISFFNDTLIITKEERPEMRFGLASSSISTSQGLAFFTNGCFIYNQGNELIVAGDQINLGEYRKDCGSSNTYPSGYGSTLILPDPYKDEYYLIHQTIQQFYPDEYSQVHYSKIDMNAEGGKGAVVELNIRIMPDSVYLGEMSAVKHANGKDWWIVVPEDSNNVYNVLLLDSLGIRKSHEQVMGPKIGYYGTGSGQCQFSPNGKKFARWTFTQQLFLADFDRFDGTFSNFQQIHVQDTVSYGGVCFSPDSRFLYVSCSYHVDQFDMQAINVQESQITVAEYDGFADFVRTYLVRMQLTPDCRIFINSPGGHRYWHIIEHPNEKGLACNVRQHSLRLPTWTFNTMPYFPNYYLGPVGQEGYPCDSTRITVSSTQVPVFQAPGFVYPNPATDILHIDLPPATGPLQFDLLNAHGQMVLRREAILPGEEINTSNLSSGLYYYRIMDRRGRVWSGKVVAGR